MMYSKFTSSVHKRSKEEKKRKQFSSSKAITIEASFHLHLNPLKNLLFYIRAVLCQEANFVFSAKYFLHA